MKMIPIARYISAILVVSILLFSATAEDLRWKRDQSLSLMANTAKQAQLSYIGAGTAVDRKHLFDYLMSIANSSQAMDPKVLMTNSPIAPLVQAVALGFILAVLIPILSITWLCFRRCNLCGGHRAKEDGYKARQIIAVISAFTVFTALTIVFANVFIGYSANTSTSIADLSTGLANFLDSGVDVLNSTASGLASSPDATNTAMTRVINDVSTGPLSGSINSSFYNLLEYVDAKFFAIEDDEYDLVVYLNETNAVVSNMTKLINGIPGKVANISSRIHALENVLVNNQTYAIAGFPDLTDLSSFTAPNLNSLPDVDSFINDIETMPDLAAEAVNLRRTITTLDTKIIDLINTTISDAFPSGSNSNSSSSNLLDGFGDSIGNLTTSARESVDKLDLEGKFDTANQYNNYRHYGFVAQMTIITLTAVIAFTAICFKRRLLMSPFCVFLIAFSILVWIEYSLFYALSAPINVICSSAPDYFNKNYEFANFLDSNSNSTNSSAAPSTIVFNPQVFIDDCLAGKKIFEADINANGGGLADLLGDMIDKMLGSALDTSSFKNAFKLPDVNATLESIDIAKLESFNTSALELSDFKFAKNLTVIRADIERSVSQFTPSSIDRNLGNYTLMYNAIDSFNTVLLNYNPMAVPFNYSYIVATYVITSREFVGEDVTGNPSDTSNNTLLYNSFTNNGVKTRVSFIYNAELELQRVKNGINSNLNDLHAIETHDVASLLTLSRRMAVISDSISTLIDHIVTVVQDLKVNLVPLLNASVDSFIDWLITYTAKIISSAIKGLINSILMENPVADFGSCQAIASNFEYVVDGVCVGTLDSLSGMWFSLWLLGVFMVFAFITTVLAKKRIASIEKKRNSVRDGYDKEKAADGKGKVDRKSKSITATAPIASHTPEENYAADNDANKDNYNANAPLIEDVDSHEPLQADDDFKL